MLKCKGMGKVRTGLKVKGYKDGGSVKDECYRKVKARLKVSICLCFWRNSQVP